MFYAGRITEAGMDVEVTNGVVEARGVSIDDFYRKMVLRHDTAFSMIATPALGVDNIELIPDGAGGGGGAFIEGRQMVKYVRKWVVSILDEFFDSRGGFKGRNLYEEMEIQKKYGLLIIEKGHLEDLVGAMAAKLGDVKSMHDAAINIKKLRKKYVTDARCRTSDAE